MPYSWSALVRYVALCRPVVRPEIQGLATQIIMLEVKLREVATIPLNQRATSTSHQVHNLDQELGKLAKDITGIEQILRLWDSPSAPVHESQIGTKRGSGIVGTQKDNQINQKDWTSNIPPWLAVLVTCATLVSTVWLHSQDQVIIAHDRLLEHRREALFSALKVIDTVYSNEKWNGKPPVHPINVDIQSARDAYNQMLLYCQYPETLTTFRKALGVWNPQEDKSPSHPSIEGLDDFRAQVAKELDLPPIQRNSKYTWINNLDGAE